MGESFHGATPHHDMKIAIWEETFFHPAPMKPEKNCQPLFPILKRVVSLRSTGNFKLPQSQNTQRGEAHMDAMTWLEMCMNGAPRGLQMKKIRCAYVVVLGKRGQP